MRTAAARPITTLALALVGAGLFAACGHEDIAAPPAGSSATSTRPAPTTTGATPTPRPTAAASPRKTATTAAPIFVLGPYGYGPLKLGQSLSAARATHILADLPGTNAECNPAIIAGRITAPDPAGYLFFKGKAGLIDIYAVPGARTPEGIGLGSTTAEVLAAYPTWETVDDGVEGHGHVRVPGNAAALYRIATSQGKVIQLSLQRFDVGCYE